MNASVMRSTLQTAIGADGQAYGYAGAGLRGSIDDDMFVIVAADSDALGRILAAFGWEQHIDWKQVKQCVVTRP